MRMVPNRLFTTGDPIIAKKDRALLVHVSPPIKGLAEDAKTAESDVKTAGILINLYAEDDRLTVRAGHKKIASMPGGKPVEHLIPYYGEPKRIIAATNKTLCDAETGLLLKSGYTNNDWYWTMHSDLGATDRVVMVNGADGVVTWDGGTTADVGPVTITKIGKATSPATDAVVTVALADIAKFKNGDGVTITGADAGHASANGPQRIAKVNEVPNTFELVGVNSTGWGGDQTTGTMRVTVHGSFVPEAIKPPAGNTWMQVNDLHLVAAHQNRLFFADETNLCVYYLPLQQRYGELKLLPLNAIFKRGGTIKAMNTWTVDGGMGMDDQLVVFTTNGEVAIYSGIDPATDFKLVGVFRMEPPMSKWSTMLYGGELYALTPTGLTPMSATLKSGREGVEASDKTVVSFFRRMAIAFRENPGWEVYLNPNTGRIMCNVPRGGGVYTQMNRSMAKPAWTEFKDIPARCWAWIEPYNYFGDDFGNVYQMHPSIQSDQHLVNGVLQNLPIYIDVQTAWSQFKTPAIKHFKMVLPYIITDGSPKPAIDVKVDFDSTDPVNVPDPTASDEGQATWDVAVWDLPLGAPAQPARPDSKPTAQAATPAVGPISGDYWVSGTRNWANWTGVGSIGRVGCIRMTARIYNCSFSILGWDVLYDRGSVFG